MWFAYGVVASLRARMNFAHTEVIQADKPLPYPHDSGSYFMRALIDVATMVDFDRNYLCAHVVSYLAPLGFMVSLLPEGVEIEFTPRSWTSFIQIYEQATTTKGGT